MIEVNETTDKNTALSDNTNVQELFSVLKENNRDTAGLTALLSYVKQMEEFVKSAESQIGGMRSQIDELKEIQKHPIKTALTNASDSLKTSVDKVKWQLTNIKESIIKGCKNAVKAFKGNGTIALDNSSVLFRLKQGFEAMEKNSTAAMEKCDKAVAKIERFSSEYHETGLHLKNMLKMIAGKEPSEKAKEMGDLAKILCVQYKAEKKCFENICKTAKKAVAGVVALDNNVEEAKKLQQELKPTFDKLHANAEAKLEQKNVDNGIPLPQVKPKTATTGVTL